MRRHFIRVAVLASFVFMSACSGKPSKELLENLMQQQEKNRLAIGWVDDQKLKVILFSLTKPEMRSYTLADGAKKLLFPTGEQSPVVKVDGTDIRWSHDRKWFIYRTRENKFVLADPSGNIRRFLFDGRQLTPLRWSPNDDFLMYVKKGATWEPINPMRCLDDTEDVMVYRIEDGQQARVFQVCAGYPYWELDWLRVPANLPL